MTQLIIILTLLIIIRVLTAMIVFSRPALWTCTPICTRWTYFTNYRRPTFSSKYLELLALYSTFLPWRPPKSKLHSILTSARNPAGHRPKSLLDQVTPSQGPPTHRLNYKSKWGGEPDQVRRQLHVTTIILNRVRVKWYHDHHHWSIMIINILIIVEWRQQWTAAALGLLLFLVSGERWKK